MGRPGRRLLRPGAASGIPGAARAAGSRISCFFLIAALVLATAGQAAAQDCAKVPEDWALNPPGFVNGGKFRLLFVTSGTLAPGSEDDIAYYNEKIRTAANSGHAAIYQRYNDRFSVLASTADVDARDNTGTTGTGVPIYWLGGQKVADDYADFYDGSWDSISARNQRGNSLSDLQNVHVWTGSASDGREFFANGGVSAALGARNVAIGRPWHGSGLNSNGAVYENDNSYPLYGLSDVFCIASRVTLSWTPTEIDEGGAEEIAVTATVNGDTLTEDTAVRISVASGTAIEGTDFAAVADFDLTIAAGATSVSGSFTLAPVDDVLVEDDETVAISGTASGLAVAPDPGQATLAIRDDDTHRIALSWTPTEIDESGGEEVTVTATLIGGARSEDTPVGVSIGPGTATEGTDFAAVADFNLTIAAGATSASGGFTLVPVDDILVEDDETVAISGTAGDLAVAPAAGQAALAIADDDAYRILLSWTPTAVDEGGEEEVTVTATLIGGARSEDTAVRMSVASGTATEGGDFASVADFDLTIAAGATTGSAGFTLAPVDDALVEDDETVSISGAAPGIAVAPSPGQDTLTIRDDDISRVELSWTPAAVDESGEAEIAVTATLIGGARTEDTAVRVSVASGTAIEGVDFAAVADFDLTIAGGATEENGGFTLAPVDDALVEGDETVSIVGTASGFGVAPAAGQAALAIRDDDSHRVELSWSPTAVDEGGGEEVTVTARLIGGVRAEDTAVRITVASGTATEGGDFASVDDFDLTIPAGGATGGAGFTLAPVDDALVEDDETVAIFGAAAGIAVAPSAGQDTLTIKDDDSYRVELSWSPSTVDEGGEAEIAIAAALIGGVRAEDTAIRVSVASSTATEGADFAAVADFDLTIPAGGTTGGADFTLATVDDTLVEDDETVSISGASPGIAVAPSAAQAPLTIADNDRPTLSFSLDPGFFVADAEGMEGPDATLAFVVTLEAARAVATTVDYATGDGTATAGMDYVAASGTLTFAAGEISQTLHVTILDDAYEEPRETMTLTLSNPSAGSRIGDGSATGAILNTDALPHAWSARFGRVVGGQIVKALADRFQQTGTHATVGGAPIGGDAGLSRRPGPGYDAAPGWIADGDRERRTQTATAREVLLGSSFHAAAASDSAGAATYAAWGSVAGGRFDSKTGGVNVDASVLTGFLGFDAAWERATVGAVISHSEGEGGYSLVERMGDDRGTVESAVTGVYPYARLKLSGRLAGWAVVGAGRGKLTFRARGMSAMRTDVRMRMGAVGLDGAVLDGSGPSGIDVTIRSDAMWVRTETGRAIQLAPTESDVLRFRLHRRGFARIRGGRRDADALARTRDSPRRGRRRDRDRHRRRRGAPLRPGSHDAGRVVVQARRPPGFRLRGVGRFRRGAYRAGSIGPGAFAQAHARMGRGRRRRKAIPGPRRCAGARAAKRVRGGVEPGCGNRLRVRARRRAGQGDPLFRPLARPGCRLGVARGGALGAHAGCDAGARGDGGRRARTWRDCQVHRALVRRPARVRPRRDAARAPPDARSDPPRCRAGWRGAGRPRCGRRPAPGWSSRSRTRCRRCRRRSSPRPARRRRSRWRAGRRSCSRRTGSASRIGSTGSGRPGCRGPSGGRGAPSRRRCCRPDCAA